jgi:hypothetical protein
MENFYSVNWSWCTQSSWIKKISVYHAYNRIWNCCCYFAINIYLKFKN